MTSTGQSSGRSNSTGEQPARPQAPLPERTQLGYKRYRPPEQAPRETDGYRILSYMLGGMILYGGIGWLIGHWTGLAFLFPVGMLLGLALSVGLIIFRVSKT